MIKKLITDYRANIFFFITCMLVLVFAVSFYDSTKEGYSKIFLLFCILIPCIFILKPKNGLFTDICFSVFFVMLVILYAVYFWEYKDRPLTNIKDIPGEFRGGWFSFENPLRIKLLLICSICSIFLSSVTRYLIMKVKTIRVQ